MSTTRNTLTGLLLLSLIASLTYVAGAPIAASFNNAVESKNAAFAFARATDVANRETVFRRVCPEYRDASFLQRIVGYRNISWCKDYIDRL